MTEEFLKIAKSINNLFETRGVNFLCELIHFNKNGLINENECFVGSGKGCETCLFLDQQTVTNAFHKYAESISNGGYEYNKLIQYIENKKHEIEHE